MVKVPIGCPRGVQETPGVPKLLSNGGPECQKSFQNGGFARIRESTNSASDGSLCDVDVVRLWDLWIFQDCYFVFCFRLAASIPETVRFSQMVPQASKRASKMEGSCIYGLSSMGSSGCRFRSSFGPLDSPSTLYCGCFRLVSSRWKTVRYLSFSVSWGA